MPNAVRLVEALPSLTEMTMFAKLPVADGVPLRRPVCASNDAQDGLLLIEKVSVLPSASCADGVKV